MKTFFALAIAAAALASSPVHAQTTVSDAWVRSTVPQQRASGLFLTLTSTHGGTLVAARTAAAATAEIHEMKMDGDVMRMRQLAKGLPLPAGQPVTLKPGAHHIMLMGLTQNLAVGASIPVVLTVMDAKGTQEELNVKAVVRDAGAVKTHH